MEKDTSEIVKLTERIAKDPKSKLFVPLAEEYKKVGDMEMSIHVLTEGLKHNPGYITAKSLLGRLLLEQGDLAGAQKELEEVVKAIPDNLIAQRKLGDIYALLDRPGDSLKQYKAALSLNPKDAEIASFISDIEAGRDIKARLPKPKPQPAPAEAAQKPQEALPPASTQAPQKRREVLHAGLAKAPSAAAQQASGPAKAPFVTAQPASGTPKAPSAAAKTPAAPPRREQKEEPEEVLVVEPLEPKAPVQPSPAEHFDFLAETGQGPVPAEEPLENAFTFAEPARGRVPPEPANAAPVAEETGTREQAVKQTDDFTTDTLAELYLAQGFYEKAIEIYERMLADNPGSQGLKNKLMQVRAMAGQAAPSGEKTKPVPGRMPGVEGGEGPVVEVDEADELAPGAGEGAGEFFPPQGKTDFEPVEYKPPASAKTDVEAMEYKPPVSGKAALEPEEYTSSVPGFDAEVKEPVQAAPAKSVPRGRKQTIDRLEQWLKNIVKEK